MTKNADFKRRVRAHMAATDQTYTRARAELLARPPATVDAEVAFYDKTVRNFFDGERLRSMPARRKARVVVLIELLRHFEPGRRYAETEVNDLLRRAHDDVALLRRELVDYRYLKRADGQYWINPDELERDEREAQEVPRDEAQRVPRG